MGSIKEAHSELYEIQDRALVKMFNIVYWIYLGVWICQSFEFSRDTQGSELVWVCSWMILECLNMPETEPNITLQVK